MPGKGILITRIAHWSSNLGRVVNAYVVRSVRLLKRWWRPDELPYSWLSAPIDHMVGNQSQSSMEILTRREPDSLSPLPEGSITPQAGGNACVWISSSQGQVQASNHFVEVFSHVWMYKRHIRRINKCRMLQLLKYSDTCLIKWSTGRDAFPLFSPPRCVRVSEFTYYFNHFDYKCSPILW